MKKEWEIFLLEILILIILCLFTYIGIKNNIMITTVFCIMAVILWIALIAIKFIEDIFKR